MTPSDPSAPAVTPADAPLSPGPDRPAPTDRQRSVARQIVPIAAILAVTALVAFFVLRDEPAAAGGEEAEAVEVDYPRGPHNGRLLQPDAEGGLALEVTIAEDGIPPEFRIYPFAGGAPVPPGQVDLTVVLTRLGSVDTLGFERSGDFLRSTSTVTEPHSFVVDLVATYQGQTSLWSYDSIEGRTTMTDDVMERAGVEIEPAGPATILEGLHLPGEVALNTERQAHVTARFPGVVSTVTVGEGDFVRQGQLLAVVESRQLVGVADDYVRAAHRLHYVEGEYERERQLFERRISAEREFRAAEHELEEARIALQVAEQSLVAAGIPRGRVRALDTEPTGDRGALASLARVEVRAPTSGLVTARDVSEGESVSDSRTLFTIADLSTVWVEVTVYQRDLATVRPGMTAVVRSDDTGAAVEGRVRFVGQVVGQESRAATARIVLPNPGGRWRPGQFVEVDLATAVYDVPLAVRTDAIQDFRDFRVVYARHDGQFEVRMLQLGVSDSTYTEVLGGIRPGEPYAATNSFIVKADIGKSGATHDH